jgi:hypothetical protein
MRRTAKLAVRKDTLRRLAGPELVLATGGDPALGGDTKEAGQCVAVLAATVTTPCTK